MVIRMHCTVVCGGTCVTAVVTVPYPVNRRGREGGGNQEFRSGSGGKSGVVVCTVPGSRLWCLLCL